MIWLKVRLAIYAAALVAVCVWLYIRGTHLAKKENAIINSTILAPTDAAKIIVDSRRHVLTTVTAHGVRREFLPDSGAAVVVRKDGTTYTESRKLGTELRPYLGFALDQEIKPHAALGLDLVYVYRVNFGGGLLVDSSIRDTRAYVAATYNVWNNTSLGVSYDNRRDVGLIVSIRF